MQFKTGKPRSSTAAARALAAAGIVLAVAGCSSLTPLGPDAAATMPTPSHLRSPVTVEAMTSQPLSPGGGCPAGRIALTGPVAVKSAWGSAGAVSACYGTVGTPVTSTSAGVTPVSSHQPPPPPPGGAAEPGGYAFTIVLPAADVPALTVVTTRVAGPPNDSSPSTSPVGSAVLALSVAGKTWLPDWAGQPSKGQLQIIMPSRDQALQLHHLLAPPS